MAAPRGFHTLSRMGIFTVEVEVAGASVQPSTFVNAGQLIVDTGAEISWVRDETLRQAGVTVRKPAQRFEMANGQSIVRDVGYAVIRAQGFETIDEVAFALDSDLELLGSRTIEGFNARVDPERKRLVAAGPIIAAQHRRR
jgi:predicted aspartyl protease